MATPTQPLRDEHRELLPEVEVLLRAGRAFGTDRRSEALTLAGEALAFLQRHLIPHAIAEDRALYPVVGRILGDARATATMSRDHVEVGQMTQALADLLGQPEPDGAELQRLLLGLYAIVKLHFAKEEEVYLPWLDASLSEEQARAMFQAMEAAAVEAKAAAG